MLIIRNNQVQVLEEDLQKRHHDVFSEILQKCCPETAEALGSKGVNEWILAGREAAAQKGFLASVNVERYIHLMFLLNERDLGESPQTAWVTTILGWPDVDEDYKMEALEKRAQAEMIARLQQQIIKD